MGAAFDQPLLVQLVEHAPESDRLDIEPGCDLGLAHPLAARDVEQCCRLRPSNRQSGVPRRAFETTFEEPRDVMDEKAKAAVDGPIGTRL